MGLPSTSALAMTLARSSRRVAPASLHQRDKVGLKFAEQTKQFPGMPGRIAAPAFAASKVHILACEQLLCQFEHPRLVLLRNAEDLHEDAQRIMNRDIAHEIAGWTAFGHAIDAGAGNGADAMLQ